MKEIDGKATRRQKYPRMFFWYVPLGSLAWIAYGLYAFHWDWTPLAAFLIPGLLLGIVLGVAFRDTP